MNATDNLAHSRAAVPALLAFVDEVLALCDKADANPEDGLRKVHTASIRQAAGRHFGGAR